MTKKKYDLVISHDLASLISTTNEAIKEGYVPIGGVLFHDHKFIQAILLVDEDEG